MSDPATLAARLERVAAYFDGTLPDYERTVREAIAAADLLQHLIEHGSWYISAIELDHDQDGEDLLERAYAVLSLTERTRG